MRALFESEFGRVWLRLLPALSVILLLFGGGVLFALSQSFGYFPVIGLTDFTWAYYGEVFSDPAFFRSLALTIWISTVATAASTVLALVCALSLRRQIRGSKVVQFLFQLNLPIPHLVGAIGILLIFSQSGLFARLAYFAGFIEEPSQFPALIYDAYGWGIIFEYVWKSTCFIGVILLANLQSLGTDYEEAARSLGASEWQRFRFVTLPFLTPAILSSSTLVFAFTFGAFEVPFLLGRRFPSALSVLAYRKYVSDDLADRPEAMAISIVITVVIIILVQIYSRFARQTIRDD